MLGMMEIVDDSETISDIHIASVSKSVSGAKRKAAAASLVWKPETLSKWLKEQVSARAASDATNGSAADRNREAAIAMAGEFKAEAGRRRISRDSSVHKISLRVGNPYAVAQDTFARSCAGYCAATYVLKGSLVVHAAVH